MREPLELVLATANAGKVAEIVSIFARVCGDRVVLLPRPADIPDIDESGETLEENARLKARTIAVATGLPAVADDTGLEVRALGGAPGVRSARYAGEAARPIDNVVKMLAELESEPDRAARFTTVAAVVWPDGNELMVEASIEGAIASEARGAGGFGYDPIFVPAGSGGRSFAEMSEEAKNSISHRGIAFRALAGDLADTMGWA